MALPTDLNLTPKAQGVTASSIRVNVTPLNNTVWSPNDSVMFDFPVNRANTYLNGAETTLMMRIKNNDTTSNIWIDHSAASFIQRIDVYSSGNLIETIDNYNVLYCALLDSQTSGTDRCSHNNLLIGTDNDTTNNDWNVSRGGVSIAAGATATFYLPIVSGVIGSSLNRYLPLCDLAELKVVVTLASREVPVIAGSANPTTTQNLPLWQLTACEFVLTVIQLDPSVDKALHDSHGGQIVLSTETWRNFNTILTQGNTGDQILVPIKPISAKSLLVTYRPNPNLTSLQAQSVSGRVNPFGNATGSSFQLLCGSTYVPAKPIQNGSPELFMELYKCFHGTANVNSKTCINAQNYEVIGNPATALTIPIDQDEYNTYVQATGTFLAGINLDIFSGQSSKALAGRNLSVGNTFIIQSYKSGTPLGQQTRLDGFLHFDELLLIDPVTKQMTFKM